MAASNLHGVIRIVFVGVNGLMADVVRNAIAGDSQMTVISDLPQIEHLVVSEARRDFDVVVTELRRGERDLSPAFQRLLFQFPHVALVVLTREGDRIEVFDRNVVKPVPPARIPELIRQCNARTT